MTDRTDPSPASPAVARRRWRAGRGRPGGPDSGAPAAPATTEPETGIDVGRRRFFRQFAGELFQGAARVVGAAQTLQRVSAEAAGSILDPDAFGVGSGGAAAAPDRPTGFRTPFRESPSVIHIIDQRRLPDALVEYDAQSAAEVAFAIREMIIRGAPAIGQVAGLGLALTAAKARSTRPYARRATLRGAANALINARPTAVNLRWAVERVMATYDAIGDLSEDGDAIADAMRGEADAIVFETTEDHGRLARFGLEALVFPDDGPLRVLTHCNTGPLACGQFGTALGVIQAAHHAGRAVHVWVDETRPYLQGARLTAWELAQAEVPHTLIPDVAAGHLMATGEVDAVLVGADRIAANGDTANKVGTYTLAVLAARHGIPFYVAAPISTVDLGDRRWRRDPDRGAPGDGGARVPRRADRPARYRGAQPVVRRHAGRPHHRDRHRRRRRAAPLSRRPGRAVARRDRRRASSPGFGGWSAPTPAEPAAPAEAAAPADADPTAPVEPTAPTASAG